MRAVGHHAREDLHPANYEEWMRGFFGDGIAEHLMIPYAKKIWTVDPATMDFSWTSRRVPTPQVERIIRGALTDDVGSTGETARFWYPKTGGIEQLPRALGKKVNNVHLRRLAERIELPERRVIFSDGTVISFEHLVYTLPLPFLPNLVAGLPAEVERACAALRYQGVHCVNLGIDREHITNKHWIYFYEDSFPFHRLSFPVNFSSGGVPPGKSSISAEVAFSKWRPLEPVQAAERTVDALRLAGILDSDDTVELVHTETICPAQVIYGPDDRENIATIRGWLRTHGIHVAGRFGEWQYFNMDHSMRSGKNVAEAILGTRQRR